jgi:hypothetical protein
MLLSFLYFEMCFSIVWQLVAATVVVTAAGAASSDPYADVNLVAATPGSTLAVRGLPLFSGEDQVRRHAAHHSAAGWRRMGWDGIDGVFIVLIVMIIGMFCVISSDY